MCWFSVLNAHQIFWYSSEGVVQCENGTSGVSCSYQVFILEWPHSKTDLQWNESNLWGGYPIIRCLTSAYQFRCIRRSVEIAPIPGWSQSAIYQVETAILVDHITFRQLAQEVKISVGKVNKIIHGHLQNLFARWVLRLLTLFQKQEKGHSSKDLLATKHENQEVFFDRLIM